jgi:hypothetical protein
MAGLIFTRCDVRHHPDVKNAHHVRVMMKNADHDAAKPVIFLLEIIFFLGIATEQHAMCTILNLPPSFCNTRSTRRRAGYTTVTRHKFFSL